MLPKPKRTLINHGKRNIFKVAKFIKRKIEINVTLKINNYELNKWCQVSDSMIQITKREFEFFFFKMYSHTLKMRGTEGIKMRISFFNVKRIIL